MIVESNIKLAAAVDRTLQYFALFQYPLLPSEIRRYCGAACVEEEVLSYLEEQEMLGGVFRFNGFYCLLPDVEPLLQRRMRGNEKAIKDLKKARRVGRFIYQFPFVSFVGISGSLSKGYSDEHSDFDFFIITRKDRLWVTRTLLHLMKKCTFIFGQQHKFCMNYFIDETALVLQEKNIYTATELNSLIPVCGSDIHRQFMSANDWVRKYLPNYAYDKEPVSDCTGLFKKLCTGIIELLPAASFNRFLMKLTDAKWRRKWARKRFPAEDYDLAFKTRINISKNHHLNYQKRVLSALSPTEE
jgi:hypothetical protein